MTDLIPIVRTVAELRETVNGWRKAGLRVGLVPTMGALHHGHLSLVDAVAAQADRIVVSIFVNPTQFGEGEDFDAYPRQETTDREKLASTSASLIFAPGAAEMYRTGHASTVSVSGITTRFEGAARPDHFDGVATIVTKLLLQCLPDVAIFGEKDYQQLAVIRRFVADLDIPVRIMGGKLIREPDGLAASSRNAYLNDAQRAIAGHLNITLKTLVDRVADGVPVPQAEAEAESALMGAGFDAVDYVSIVDADTLEPTRLVKKEARVLAVARLGGVRLLDNMAVMPPKA